MSSHQLCIFVFFFNDTATTEIYTLSLHDALPICTSDLGIIKIKRLANMRGVKVHLGELAFFTHEQRAGDLNPVHLERAGHLRADQREHASYVCVSCDNFGELAFVHEETLSNCQLVHVERARHLRAPQIQDPADAGATYIERASYFRAVKTN